MRLNKIFLWILILAFFFESVFSYGYYDSRGDFINFVSNPTPTIDINITSGNRELQIGNGLLNFDNVETVFENQDSLSFLSQGEYSFFIQDEINELSDVRFELDVRDKNSGKKIIPLGDPIKFKIVLDQTTPELVSFKNNIETNDNVVLEFSEPIRFVEVYVNGVFHSKVNNLANNFRLKDERFVQVDLPITIFSQEKNTLKFVFEDFAQNSNEEEREIFIQSEPLNIKLLTLKDDSNLVYFYNTESEFKELFNGNIYTKSTDFELKIETNKPANCYYLDALINKNLEFKDAREPKEFLSSTTGLSHSIDVTNSINELWVVCQNKFYDKEIVYLTEQLGIESTKVLGIELYNIEPVKIIYSDPKTLVTSIPTSYYVETSSKAVCFSKLNSYKEFLPYTQGFMVHNKSNIEIESGRYNLEFECFDVLNNVDRVSSSLLIDTNGGIKVVDYSPKYTISASVNVEVSLSDESANCKYSLTDTAKKNFDSMNDFSVSGNKKIIQLNSLVSGENIVNIFCSDENQIYGPEQIKIIYDTKGIILSNFMFEKNGFLSDFLSSYSNIDFQVNVSSLIPIKEFVLVVDYGNFEDYNRIDSKSTDEEVFQFKSGISGEFLDAKKVSLYAINMLDINKSIEKQIKIDLTPPFITFSNVNGGRSIICSDLESGCSKIMYGFSQTSFDCLANQIYDNNPVDISAHNYLCVDAYNNAGLKTSEIDDLSLINRFENDLTQENNQTTNNEEDEVEIDEEQEENNETKNEEDDIFVFDPNQNENESSNTGIILIGALALILLGISGGGYYAYKKGYLNKELEKLGIKTNQSKNLNINNSQSNTQNKGYNFTTSPIKNQNDSNLKSSNYDNHLKKLNKFIDSKIGNSKGLFDKFNDSSKGKHEKYHDTLIKKNNESKLTKEEYDEFYEKSSSTNTQTNEKQSLKDEADSFEKYYKDKKDKTKIETKKE